MSPPFVQSGDNLDGFLRSFWQRQISTAENEAPDFRHPPLPLARIKKVMKSDPDVKMIAADAPILFCKACEIFIAEITARAFIVADTDKRRTLSRSDIAKAIGKSDQFDFLIDIVPRDEPPNSATTKKTRAKREDEISEEDRHSRSRGESTIEIEDLVEDPSADDGAAVEPAEIFSQLQNLLNPQPDG